jgi:hypothetical protein
VAWRDRRAGQPLRPRTATVHSATRPMPPSPRRRAPPKLGRTRCAAPSGFLAYTFRTQRTGWGVLALRSRRHYAREHLRQSTTRSARRVRRRQTTRRGASKSMSARPRSCRTCFAVPSRRNAPVRLNPTPAVLPQNVAPRTRICVMPALPRRSSSKGAPLVRGVASSPRHSSCHVGFPQVGR